MANVIDILIKAQDQASGVMRAVESAASSLNSEFDKSVGASKSVATGLLAAGAAGAAFIGYGAKMAADIETARAGFVTLLGSSQKADAIISQIKKDAASTPFEFNGLVQANQLLTSVTHNGQQSETLLLNVGKALAAMGKGQPELDRIVINLQQIGAVGHATLMDIRQFAYNGIPIFEMLQKQTGLTGDALATFISNGGVTFDMLQKMFNDAGMAGGRFANAFTQQAGTFNQLLSNMGDTVSQAAAQIVTKSGMFDVIKQAMAGFIAFLGAHTDDITNFIIKGFGWIKDNGALVAGVLAGLLAPAVLSVVGCFVAGAVSLAPWVVGFTLLALGAQMVADKMGGWDKMFSAIGGAIRETALGFSAFFAAFKEGDVTSDGFVGIMERIGVTLRAIWSVAQPIVAFIAGAFVAAFKELWKVIATQLWPAMVQFKPVLEALAVVLGGVLLVAVGAIVAAFYLLVKAVTWGIQIVAVIFNAVMSFSSFVIDSFNAAVAAIVAFWQGLVGVVTTVINAIVGTVNAVGTVIAAVWQGMVTAAAIAWNTLYATIIQPVVNLIVGTINVIGAVVNYLWQWIMALTALAWNWIYSTAIQPVVNAIVAIMNWCGGVINAIWNGIRGAAIAVWAGIVSFVTPMINSISTAVRFMGGVVNGIWNSVSSSARGAWQGIANFIGGIVSWVRQQWQGLSNWFSTMWSNLGKGVSGFGTSISNGISGAMNSMKDMVKGAVNWVIDHINGMIDSVNSVADKVPGAPKMGHIARLADGTNNWAGGVALVGERGPEMVNLPKGAQVYSATNTANALRQTAGGGQAGVHIDKLEVNNNVDVGLVIRQIGWKLTT